jgi:hypothetical protein
LISNELSSIRQFSTSAEQIQTNQTITHEGAFLLRNSWLRPPGFGHDFLTFKMNKPLSLRTFFTPGAEMARRLASASFCQRHPKK